MKQQSSLQAELLAGDRYSMGLFILVLAAFSLQLPLILNVIVQLCFLVCTLHVAYRYFEAGRYFLELLKMGLIVAVGFMDDVYVHILCSQ